MITVEGLSKTYAGSPPTIAAHDISFSIGPGESLGVVGESGSGKTTVARMLVGLTTPDTPGP